MDKQAEEALRRLDNTTVLTLQGQLLWCAVQALIETHPDPQAMRAAFDRAWGRTQATASYLAAPEDFRALVRELVKSLFPDAQ
jgi:hypothetical protein